MTPPAIKPQSPGYQADAFNRILASRPRSRPEKFFRDQNRSSFEIFGLRPRPEIIKTETGNYPASKKNFISPNLINLFFIFPKSYNYVSSKPGFLSFSKGAFFSNPAQFKQVNPLTSGANLRRSVSLSIAG